jgi:DNA-binding NtrC family response regulator
MKKNLLQVVVVDDESQITDLLRTFLLCISSNLDVHTFNDSEEARTYIQHHMVDVLITDFKMPKYDGIQLMKIMPMDSMKILISGYVSEITEGQLNNLKASFFEKPVSMKDLGALILEAEAKKK